MKIFCILILAGSIAGCDAKPQVRHYTEMVIEAPSPKASESKIVWKVPAGWQEEAGTDMRLATFRLASNPKAFDCSIVFLSGGAGGVGANLKRWMGQIHLEISDAELAEFIQSSPDYIFDFTRLLKKTDDNAASMIAAIVNLKGNTVFVKLAGTVGGIKIHKAAFLALVKSVRMQ